MRFISAATILLAFGIPALGQETTKKFTHTKTKQADLEIVVHYPPSWKETDKRPGIVFFFFGGGWPRRIRDASCLEEQETYGCR